MKNGCGDVWATYVRSGRSWEWWEIGNGDI